jgi:hypothetical protein
VPDTAVAFGEALDDFAHELAEKQRDWNRDEKHEDDWGSRKVDAAADLIDPYVNRQEDQ